VILFEYVERTLRLVKEDMEGGKVPVALERDIKKYVRPGGSSRRDREGGLEDGPNTFPTSAFREGLSLTSKNSIPPLTILPSSRPPSRLLSAPLNCRSEGRRARDSIEPDIIFPSIHRMERFGATSCICDERSESRKGWR